ANSGCARRQAPTAHRQSRSMDGLRQAVREDGRIFAEIEPERGMETSMTDKPRYVRPLSPESRGEAPGRKRLEGRRILVVGGGQRTFDAATDPVGNGRAMSLLFAKEGAHVAVADIFRASADDTVGRITAEGGRALSIEADIAREADVNRMIDEAVDGLGGLDGMVLNVGI